MTSASSSSPKKGLSFFSYHRNLFGRRLWVGVVSIVLQLLFYTVATPLRIVYDRSQVADQLTTEIARATYRTKQAQMIRPMDTTNWKPMRPVLKALPLAAVPKLPLTAKAGENEVMYRAG